MCHHSVSRVTWNTNLQYNVKPVGLAAEDVFVVSVTVAFEYTLTPSRRCKGPTWRTSLEGNGDRSDNES